MSGAMNESVPDNDSIGQVAYRRIRTDIIFGRLGPGQKLRLEVLREEYGASVSTLRELLSRLASEGFVVAEGHRGFEVAPVSGENLKDIAAMRVLLEAHAMEQSFKSGDMEWEGRVVSAHHKLALMEKRMIAGDRSDTETWKRYDWEFHRALISACGSNTLLETHAAIFDKYLRYLMIALTFRGEIAAREHQQMMEAALKRDFSSARKLLLAHIDGGVEHALARGTIGGTAAPDSARRPARMVRAAAAKPARIRSAAK
jgi:DNA-binding GntR family transcriptional regulator